MAKIRQGSTAKLVGIRCGESEAKSISNMVLRKLKFPDFQRKELTDNSICMVCSYRFHNKTRGWADNIKAICHPFHKRAASIFPKNKRLYRISESDFLDSSWVPADRPKVRDLKYDFAIFTLDTRDGIKSKGYHMLPIISRMAAKLDLKGMYLDYYPKTYGRTADYEAEEYSLDHDLIVTREHLKKTSRHLELWNGTKNQKQLLEIMRQARFIIFPNTRDASPRMLTEAIIRGVPVLVNKNIYGGWKYITEVNGHVFDGPQDLQTFHGDRGYYDDQVEQGMQYMIDTDFNERKIVKDYYAQYGIVNSARSLATVINNIEGDHIYDYVMYKDLKDPLLSRLNS